MKHICRWNWRILVLAASEQLRIISGIEKAGSTDSTAVIQALGEVTVEGPRGSVIMNKQRHASLNMYLGRVAADGSVQLVKSFPKVDPGEQCPQFANK